MVVQTKTCISLVDGSFFDLLSPKDNTYDIEVIAHALSRINRFTGHIDCPCYSVAEHSVLVSVATDPRYALEGLLHDASEAFVGDVSSPLKRILGSAYTDIEDAIQKEIAVRYSLIYPFPKEIHAADKRVYWSERVEIAPGKDRLWHQDLRASRKVTPLGWSPVVAQERFLAKYYELINDKRSEQLL